MLSFSRRDLDQLFSNRACEFVAASEKNPHVRFIDMYLSERVDTLHEVVLV